MPGTDPRTTRHIIQITSCGVNNNRSTQCDMMLHALCDDGTVWQFDNACARWQAMPAIPQDISGGGYDI